MIPLSIESGSPASKAGKITTTLGTLFLSIYRYLILICSKVLNFTDFPLRKDGILSLPLSQRVHAGAARVCWRHNQTFLHRYVTKFSYQWCSTTRKHLKLLLAFKKFALKVWHKDIITITTWKSFWNMVCMEVWVAFDAQRRRFVGKSDSMNIQLAMTKLLSITNATVLASTARFSYGLIRLEW